MVLSTRELPAVLRRDLPFEAAAVAKTTMPPSSPIASTASAIITSTRLNPAQRACDPEFVFLLSISRHCVLRAPCYIQLPPLLEGLNVQSLMFPVGDTVTAA
jgi:hypothetical protein